MAFVESGHADKSVGSDCFRIVVPGNIQVGSGSWDSFLALSSSNSFYKDSGHLCLFETRHKFNTWLTNPNTDLDKHSSKTVVSTSEASQKQIWVKKNKMDFRAGTNYFRSWFNWFGQALLCLNILLKGMLLMILHFMYTYL